MDEAFKIYTSLWPQYIEHEYNQYILTTGPRRDLTTLNASLKVDREIERFQFMFYVYGWMDGGWMVR